MSRSTITGKVGWSSIAPLTAALMLSASAISSVELWNATHSWVASAATPYARPAPSAADPTVQHVAGRYSLNLANFPLAKLGYAASEFFATGTATAYRNTTPLGSDGRWSVTPASTAPYRTRFVVLRPANGAHFSGNVIIDWMNETAGTDGAVEWEAAHNEMVRSGDVYIGVSAQALGVNQIRSTAPARYGTLSHPGDSYSYDIFSQIGQAVRTQASTILSGLQPKILVAAGESQSAIYLTTYVNAIAPRDNVFDAYLIHSRSFTSAPLSQPPLPLIPAAATVGIRTDLETPVLTFATETDVLGIGENFAIRQPDSPFYRLWEVAGTSHADAYLSTEAVNDDGSTASDRRQFSAMTNAPSQLSIPGLNLTCATGFNAGEQHYVFQTALHDLINWTITGVPPRSMPRLAINTHAVPPTYLTDSTGNVLGGIRTPAVDAPVATLSGLSSLTGSPDCLLFGQTTPLSEAELRTLYPTHADFVHDWRQAVERDREAGYLLPQDATHLAGDVS